METVVTTSADGTTIGYRTLGDGPGLVVVHGAMESAGSHLELARLLADSYTVHLIDRRGRGGSGPFGDHHGIDTELADLRSVLTETDAPFVLGVSSGALIALHGALRIPEIRKVAAFEPPLVVRGSLATDWVQRYEREMAAGDTRAALVTGMLGAQMGPGFLARTPRRVLEWMTGAMITRERKKPGDQPGFAALAPTLGHDGRLVIELQDTQDDLAGLQTETLLLGGERSPAYLKVALDELEHVLPHAERVEFPKVGHGATGNRNQGGKPGPVAEALRAFLG